ncbi:hypothetical protein BJX64DRAFT_176811 [Aspergillus heterothallicus]
MATWWWLSIGEFSGAGIVHRAERSTMSNRAATEETRDTRPAKVKQDTRKCEGEKGIELRGGERQRRRAAPSQGRDKRVGRPELINLGDGLCGRTLAGETTAPAWGQPRKKSSHLVEANESFAMPSNDEDREPKDKKG